MSIPKANTFYAGVSRSLGMHIFIHFQTSSKAWEAGMFTINVVLSKREDAPELWFRLPPEDGQALSEGSYRIGPFIGVNDKWWHLERGTSSMNVAAWKPSSYCDKEHVIAEAITDVTHDVCAVLSKLAAESPITEPNE